MSSIILANVSILIETKLDSICSYPLNITFNVKIILNIIRNICLYISWSLLFMK